MLINMNVIKIESVRNNNFIEKLTNLKLSFKTSYDTNRIKSNY